MRSKILIINTLLSDCEVPCCSHRSRTCTLSISIFLSLYISLFLFFFFSSRRRHTRLQGDWSSDVCSSDLFVVTLGGIYFGYFSPTEAAAIGAIGALLLGFVLRRLDPEQAAGAFVETVRSEERRVGKECRSRWSPYH